MPCNSDYMEQTDKEKLLQTTAKLYIYIYIYIYIIKKLGLALSVQEKKDLISASKDVYCRQDYVPDLCSVLKILKDSDENKFDSIVYNAKDKTSRQLAGWYEEHEKADRKRKL